MADNGHCSTCQIYNDPTYCQSIQSFEKKIGSTKIKDNETYIKINSLLPNISQKQTYSTAEIWNQYNQILQAIKDYGEKGTRNPTQNEINETLINKDSFIYLNNYNNILLALDKNIISGNNFITKELIDSLKLYIQNYDFDSDRCNVCNTAANCPGCQSNCCDSYSCSEGCGESCGESCGEGCSEGCSQGCSEGSSCTSCDYSGFDGACDYYDNG